MSNQTNHVVQSPAERVVVLGGHFAIGASGAVSSTTTYALGLDPGARYTGAVVTQTAAEDGRYTVTFNDTRIKRILAFVPSYQGDDDDAFPTATGGACIGSRLTSVTTSALIQCVRSDTQADADPDAGSVIHWFALVQL